ncbi:hypothetical protein V6N13_068938 [Hibiscus sabdariffa]
MPIGRDPATPPPRIGKIGPYTVFITPSPSEPPVFQSPTKAPPPPPSPPNPPPVQPPPQQFDKSLLASESYSDGSFLGFFKNAAFKLQNAHSSLDDHLARWFGLNQSKYQWALDDYYESKGLEKEGVKNLHLVRMVDAPEDIRIHEANRVVCDSLPSAEVAD